MKTFNKRKDIAFITDYDDVIDSVFNFLIIKLSIICALEIATFYAGQHPFVDQVEKFRIIEFKR